MSDLSKTEELDFAYLLELMPPLHDIPEFALLPELFTILGHDKLIDLCKYAGGETLRIPTVEQLLQSIQALQLFYDIRIKYAKSMTDVPDELLPLVKVIDRVYYPTYDQ